MLFGSQYLPQIVKYRSLQYLFYSLVFNNNFKIVFLSGLLLYENIFDSILFLFSPLFKFQHVFIFNLLGCSVFVFKKPFLVGYSALKKMNLLLNVKTWHFYMYFRCPVTLQTPCPLSMMKPFPTIMTLNLLQILAQR